MSLPANTVQLVPPVVWRDVIEESITSSPQQAVRGLALGITSALHNQHTGITPLLAYQLAEAIIQKSSAYRDDPARSLVIRLRESLKRLYDSRGILKYPENDQYALILRTSVNYSVFKLIAPIIDTLCRDVLKKTMLFSENPRTSVTLTDYQAYDIELRYAFMSVCQPNSKVLPETFWQDRALTLINLTAQRSSDEVNLYPSNTLQEMDIFLNLNSSPPNTRSKQHRVDIPLPSQQVDPRLNESGIDSISMTTNTNELHRRLYSEYQYPQAIQMDRIFNSGYMAFKPPPLPIQQQDTLILAMFPGIFGANVSAFLKTTWFNFTMYMADILRSNHLDQSQFRWIEGDALYRARQHKLALKDIEHLHPPATQAFPASYRQHYLRSLGWFPDFMDSKRRFQKLNFEDSAYANHPTYPLLSHWYYGAWQMQMRDAEENDEEIESDSLHLDDYRFVHVMLFAPPEHDYDDFSFRGRFRGVPINHISITTLPIDGLTEQHWNFQHQPLLDDEWYKKEGSVFMQKLSGVLIERWITEILKEMQRG